MTLFNQTSIVASDVNPELVSQQGDPGAFSSGYEPSTNVASGTQGGGSGMSYGMQVGGEGTNISSVPTASEQIALEVSPSYWTNS